MKNIKILVILLLLCPVTMLRAQDTLAFFEKTADFLEFDIRQDEGIDCMKIISAENSEAPSVKETIDAYLNIVESRKTDKLLAAKRKAVSAISKIASDKFGEYSPIAIRLNLLSLYLESLYDGDEDAISRYAGKIKKYASQNPQLVEEGIPVVLDAVALENRMRRHFGYSPDDYLEYLTNERAVLEAFPLRNHHSYWQLRAYQAIGSSRTGITRKPQLIACTIGTEYDIHNKVKKINYGNETYRNFNNLDSWYLAKVNEISNQLYGQDIVWRVEEGTNNWRTSGNPIYSLPGNTKEDIAIYREMLGENNPNYIKSVFPVVISAVKGGGDISLIEEYVKAISNCSGLSQEQKLIYSFDLFRNLYNVNPENAQRNMSDIQYKICDGEDTNYDWDELTHRCLDFYVDKLNDWNKAFFLSGTRQRILQQLGGYFSPLTLQSNAEYLDLLGGLNFDGFEKSLKIYKDLVQIRENELNEYFLNQYNCIELSYNFFVNKDMAKSKKLVQKLLSDDNLDKDVKNYVKVIWGNISCLLKGKSLEAYNLISEAFEYQKELDTDMKDITALTGIATYFLNIAEVDKAREAIDLALDTYKELSDDAIDDQYLSLRTYLSEISTLQGNSNEKRRIIGEDLEKMNSDPLLVPTVKLLDYLWAGYNITKNDNCSDFEFLNYFISMIGRVSNSLMATSNDKEKFGIEYMFPFFAEMYWYMLQSELFERNLTEENSSEEVREQSLMRKENVNKGIIQMAPVLDFYEGLIKGKKLSIKEVSNIINYYRNKSDYYLLGIKDEKMALKALEDAAKVAETEMQKNDINIYFSNFYSQKGDYVAAEKYYRKALGLLEQKDFVDFPTKKSKHYFYYQYYKQIGDDERALNEAREFYNVVKEELDKHFQLMTQSDQENFMAMHGDPAQLICLELETNRNDLAGEVYDGLLYRTGMQLRSQQATQRSLENSKDPQLIAMRDSLNVLNLRYNTSSASTNDQAEVFDMMRKIRRLEQKIFDLTADARKDINPKVTWSMVRDKLSAEDVAIEFAFSKEHIMALVLKHNCKEPVVVELAKQSDLEQYLKNAGVKNTSALAKRIYGSGKTELYSMLWKPLENLLEGVTNVYFTAPGVLNSISFNGLCDESGTYVFDKYKLHQLTTTSELLHDADNSLPQSAMLVGDILFSPGQADKAGKVVAESREVEADFTLDDFSERGVSRQYFRYLPFTAKEIDTITSDLKGLNVKTSRRMDATEETVRGICESHPDVLHFATHGFFLATEAEAARVPYMNRFKKMLGSSMQRAGIALAGAEETWRGAEKPEDNDGILTAVEVSGLNLKGTKMAVLSACETALGEYNYEGIHGLPRGLKQAGVQSMIVSLWSVNDNSTSLFMTQFYKHWLSGLSKHEAYEQAIKVVRESFPEPYNWAPFILLD